EDPHRQLLVGEAGVGDMAVLLGGGELLLALEGCRFACHLLLLLGWPAPQQVAGNALAVVLGGRRALARRRRPRLQRGGRVGPHQRGLVAVAVAVPVVRVVVVVVVRLG